MNLPPITPTTIRVVEAVPDFDLHNDVTPTGLAQHPLETLPILIVPGVEIVLAVVESFERIDFESLVLSITHRVANDVATCLRQTVELCDELLFRPLKQIVIIAAAQEQHRLASITPVPRILIPGTQRRLGSRCTGHKDQFDYEP